MKQFTNLAIRAFLFGVLVSTVWWTLSLNASEPGEYSIVAASGVDTSQRMSTVRESWDELDVPASALSPSTGPSRTNKDETIPTNGRMLVRNRAEAYSSFHTEFLSRLRPERRMNVFRIRPARIVNDADELATQGHTNWYLVEGLNGVCFVPKQYLSANEVHAPHAELLSSNSWNVRNACITEALNNDGLGDPAIADQSADLEGNPDHSPLACGCVDDLFEPSSTGCRTEWKLIQREIIGFTKLASLTCDTGCRTFCANDLDRGPPTGLDSFELQALSRLQSGVEGRLVYSETKDEIWIVGALGSYDPVGTNTGGGQGGREFLAMSYRFARVGAPMPLRRKYARESSRSGPRMIARHRNEAFADFHNHFESQFASIVNRFGNSRMWIDDPKQIQHRLRGTETTWYAARTAEGFSIEPFRLMSNVSKTKAYPDTVTHKSRLFVDLVEPNSLKMIRVPTFSGVLDASSGFFNVSRGQFSGLLWSDFNDGSLSTPEWRLERLELIGLLKYPAPVVYSSNEVPTMAELEKAPTEPLNAFEQKAVERLRSNWSENVVVNETSDEIHIVGGLRASKSCIACHAVESGQMLGALTYRLTRIGAPETAHNTKRHFYTGTQNVACELQIARGPEPFLHDLWNHTSAINGTTSDLVIPASALVPENVTAEWTELPLR